MGDTKKQVVVTQNWIAIQEEMKNQVITENVEPWQNSEDLKYVHS